MESPFITAASIFVFFTGGLSLLMALEQLTRRIRNQVNHSFLLTLLCMGVILLETGLIAIKAPGRHPWTIYLFLTSVALIGPLDMSYYRILLYGQKGLAPKTYLHFIPAGMVFILETALQLQPASIKTWLIQDFFTAPTGHPGSLLVALVVGHVVIYLSYIARMLFSFFFTKGIAKEVRLVFASVIAALAAALIMAWGFWARSMELMLSGGAVIGCIALFVFLSQNRYPQFFQVVRREIKQKKYERSLLEGLNTGAVHTRLMELIQEERIHTDLDISLQSLAGRLALTPHELSQFLNERMGMNFRNFINQHRVEEAKAMLLREPEKSILSISFEVGFNSKSAFNTAFKKFTGLTPREFRKDHEKSPVGK